MPSLLAVLGLNVGPFRSAATEAQHLATSLGEHIVGKLGGLVGLGGGIAGMEEMIRRTVEWGAHVEDLSAKLGMPVKEVQALDFALQLTGSSVEQASKFFVQLAVNRDKALRGNKEMIDHFKALGLSLDELRRNRFTEDIIKIGETVRAGDPQKLLSDLRAIGGRGAKEMTAAFVKGLPEMIRGIEGTVAVVDEAVIASLKHTDDQIKTVTAKSRGFFASGFAGLKDIVLPSIFTTGDSAAEFRRRRDEFFKRGEELSERTDKLSESGGETAEERKAMLEKAKADHWKKIHKHAEEVLKTAREIHRLHEEARKIRDESMLKDLTSEEKVHAHQNRISDLRKQMAKMKGGKDRAALDVELAKEEKAMSEAQKEVEHPRHQIHRHDVNQLQRIGAFAANPLENMALDVHKRSEGHLREIKGHLKNLSSRNHGSEVDYQ